MQYCRELCVVSTRARVCGTVGQVHYDNGPRLEIQRASANRGRGLGTFSPRRVSGRDPPICPAFCLICRATQMVRIYGTEPSTSQVAQHPFSSPPTVAL